MNVFHNYSSEILTKVLPTKRRATKATDILSVKTTEDIKY